MNKTLILLNQKNDENSNIDPYKIKTWNSNILNLQDLQFDCKSNESDKYLNESHRENEDVKVLFSR